MTAHVPHLTVPKPFDGIRRWFGRVIGMSEENLIELKVHLAYDDEADVWYVAETDVPGLSLEADSVQRLIERIEECACELIELNAAEIEARFAPKKKQPITVRPIFDSPLQLAEACA